MAKKKSTFENIKKHLSSSLYRSLAAAAGAIFVCVFIFNLARPNAVAAVSQDEMEENIAYITRLQTVEIETVDKAVKQIEKSFKYDSRAGVKLKYRRKFSRSVILGDSLTEGLVVYGWLPKSIVFADIGGSILYSDKNFSKAAGNKPDKAYFAYGMNDMGNFAGDDKAFISKYTELIETFKEKSPDTKINICSITTPTKAARKGNKSIRNYKKFNDALRKMCKKNGYNYIDVSDILPEHRELYEGDGIHAKPAYYPFWMKRVVSRS